MDSASISKDASDLLDERQVVGRKIWRVVPYVKKYWRRAMGGVAANAMARAFDLIPFIALGLAADYYRDEVFTSGSVRNFVTSDAIPGLGPISPIELGFGLLILASFTMLAIFQGLSEYLWQSTAYKVQHDIRMDATNSLMSMEASYFETRQTGNLMAVLSADVALLEDIVSDASTSIIRIAITFTTAFGIMFWMSSTLALILFIPLVLTSNEYSKKIMKAAWMTVHKLIYLIIFMSLFHYYLVIKADYLLLNTYISLFLLILVFKYIFLYKSK